MVEAGPVTLAQVCHLHAYCNLKVTNTKQKSEANESVGYTVTELILQKLFVVDSARPNHT